LKSYIVSEWSDISTHGQLFLWASTIKIQLSVLSSTKRPSSYLPVTLSWILIVLAHWSNSSQVDMMMIALYKTNTLSWILIMLAHWNNSPQVDMMMVALLLFQWASTIRIQLSVLSSTKRTSSYLPVDCCFSEPAL
jgi:hypothetical protein